MFTANFEGSFNIPSPNQTIHPKLVFQLKKSQRSDTLCIGRELKYEAYTNLSNFIFYHAHIHAIETPITSTSIYFFLQIHNTIHQNNTQDSTTQLSIHKLTK
jgi:hypothetical protein